MSDFFRRRLLMGGDKSINTEDYLTVVALEDGLTAKLSINACEYCVDGNGYWMALPADTETESINKGHTLSFRKTDPNIDTINGMGTFTVNKYFNLKGNCLSLLYGDNIVDKQPLRGAAFKKLFAGCDKLLNAEDMILSVKSIGYESCASMFRDCKNLITTPKLPATILSGYSYWRMFYGCSSLVTAPELPATTLELACYREMFNGCTSLVTAPELTVTKLASNCYALMFYNCTSLVTAPELPATTLGEACYSNMFYGCTSLTTAPKLPATTLANRCYSNMFQGCTSLTEAPKLPATTLTDSCYAYMFQYCTSLVTAPELPAEVLKDLCYYFMFTGCSNLNYIKMIATDISATSCMTNWVNGVASSGTFVKSKDATWENGIAVPSGWEVITE